MQVIIAILLLGILVLLGLVIFFVKENSKLRSTLLSIVKEDNEEQCLTINHEQPVEISVEKLPEQVKIANPEKALFIHDVIKLVNKKLPKKTEYIELLKQVDKSYYDLLKSMSNGALSVQYFKYCVCFSIGMDISEVSQCFSIEQSSVHMVRYRLKKKFGLAVTDDLDLFLHRLKSSDEE